MSTTERPDALEACLQKMRGAAANRVAIDNFESYWRLAAAGASGLILEDEIRPLLDPPRLDRIAGDAARAGAALKQTVMIKLNGGLGTSMGLNRAKTLIPVREGKNFLDLTVDQVRHARIVHDARLPLVFMNSFRTRADTLAHLARYPDLGVADLPLDFLQSAAPKIRADDLNPISWPADPSLEWCPPGHGELYAALLGTGLLDELLAADFRYASVANGDNLGAAPNAALAGWFAASGAPYAAEVCPRTTNDRKGGHLAIRRSDGQLILRDTAQTARNELAYFTDKHRHPYFHANNLWLDLAQVRDVLLSRGGVLGLPLIRNEKTVDPSDPASPRVIQLESAMGAAIEVFPGAVAIAVGRERFLPVKTTNELMLLRSDLFELSADGQLRAQARRVPEIDLDPRYYRLIDGFEELVTIVPSLRRAELLRVRGSWRFDSPAVVVGSVDLADSGSSRSYR